MNNKARMVLDQIVDAVPMPNKLRKLKTLAPSLKKGIKMLVPKVLKGIKNNKVLKKIM
jgi:hypothetical protein